MSKDNYNKFKLGNGDWIHDEQKNDLLNDDDKKRTKIVKKLMEIEYPEQRSDAWFKSRDLRITASDVGAVIGVNHYEPQYKFILKKIRKELFTGNQYTYHGKKYEQIANMIYSYRKNVKVENFGLIIHPKYEFLGASPDGIIGKYKLDGIHKTNQIGKLLEIKCPATRKIIQKGGEHAICPIYYWVQVQMQLQCCQLNSCDFWQCNIKEYNNRTDFIKDSGTESFRTKLGREKGCIIQIIPKKFGSDKIDSIYEHASFIYPPKIEMTIKEVDNWILHSINELDEEYYLDKIIYWYLENSNCCEISRDDEWFEDNLHIMKKIWNYVKFFRNNPSKANELIEFIDENEDENIIMEKIKKLYKKQLTPKK